MLIEEVGECDPRFAEANKFWRETGNPWGGRLATQHCNQNDLVRQSRAGIL